MIELVLKILIFLIDKSTSISADTKRVFYDFIEKYNGDHSSDNAKEKLDIENQIKDLTKKNEK